MCKLFVYRLHNDMTWGGVEKVTLLMKERFFVEK